jgi:hypothetical protein
LKISFEDSNGELLNIAESSNQLGSKDSAMLNSTPLESSKLIFKSPEEEWQVSYTQSHDGKVLFTGLVAEDIEICPRIVDKIMIGKPCFSGSAMNWRIPSCIYIYIYIYIYILYIRIYIFVFVLYTFFLFGLASAKYLACITGEDGILRYRDIKPHISLYKLCLMSTLAKDLTITHQSVNLARKLATSKAQGIIKGKSRS